jgi:tetratricopeptide (TPR) repeat protein
MMDNRFGTYTKYVQISHQFLFELLVVRKLIEENQGIDFELFRKIENDFAGFEYKNRLVGLLYSFAYREEAIKPLKRFFDLNPSTLNDPYLMEMVGHSFRRLNRFGKELLSTYAKDHRACHYLFEKFVDLNYLMGSYHLVVEEFMKNNQSKGIANTCAGILLHAAIFSLNSQEAEKYYEFLLENEPDTNCSAYSIAVRLSGIMLYRLCFSGESNEEELNKLFYYREMAYCTKGDYLRTGDGEFELVVCNALLQLKAFNKILMLVDDAETNYFSHAEGVVSGNYLALQCYKLYAQFSIGVDLDQESIERLKYSKTELSPARGFIIRIVYNSFMADYNFRKGDASKAESHLDKAIEISEFGRYDLCTAGLLGKMAMFYNEWGNEGKESMCLSERNAILGERSETLKTVGIIV